MTVVTSKISPIVIGSGRSKETIYTSTRATKLADGTFEVDILQYSDAAGAGGRVIGTRDSDNPNNIVFNDRATGKVKQLGRTKIISASKDQMVSMQGQFVTKAQEAEEFNAANGNRNQALAPPESQNKRADVESADAQPLSSTSQGKTRELFPKNLKYPLDLAQQTQDYLKIDMIKYKPSGFQNRSGGLGPPPRPELTDRDVIGKCFLPIASGIQDTNAVTFGPENMSALQAEAALVSLTAMQDGFVAAGTQLQDVAGRVAGNSAGVKAAIQAYFAGQATGVGQQILQRGAGAVFNPNMELLFNAPTLRPFNFTYKMSARSKEEGDMIIKIIRFFKQGMAPQRTPSNLFLKTPHTFKLEYVQNNAPHKFLNKFKECALQSFQVQYAPEGTYSTFSDGKMTSYQLSFTFQELEPVFNDNYENDGDQSIGF